MRSAGLAALLACCGCAANVPREGAIPDRYVGFTKGEAIRCSWGLADSCIFAAKAYHYGLGAPPDATLALQYYQSACSLGAVDACVMAGTIVVERRQRNAFANTVDTWERACDDGSYRGCYLAGYTLALDPREMGVVRDLSRGRAYLQKACAAHYLPACCLGAAITIQQADVSKYDAAHEELVEGCRLRERGSCHYLGLIELQGTIGARDERGAAEHFWRACYDGLGESCLALAYLYTKGIGAVVNTDKAKKLTTEACRFDYQPACEALKHPERDLPPPAQISRGAAP